MTTEPSLARTHFLNSAILMLVLICLVLFGGLLPAAYAGSQEATNRVGVL